MLPPDGVERNRSPGPRRWTVRPHAPVLRNVLHWLPVPGQRIVFTVATITFDCVCGTGPIEIQRRLRSSNRLLYLPVFTRRHHELLPVVTRQGWKLKTYLSPQFSRKWRSSLFLNIFSNVKVTVCSGKQFQSSHTLLEKANFPISKLNLFYITLMNGLSLSYHPMWSCSAPISQYVRQRNMYPARSTKFSRSLLQWSRTPSHSTYAGRTQRLWELLLKRVMNWTELNSDPIFVSCYDRKFWKQYCRSRWQTRCLCQHAL